MIRYMGPACLDGDVWCCYGSKIYGENWKIKDPLKIKNGYEIYNLWEDPKKKSAKSR